MQDNARYPEGVKKFTIDRGSPRTEDRKYFSAGYGELFFVFDASNSFKDFSVFRRFLAFYLPSHLYTGHPHFTITYILHIDISLFAIFFYILVLINCSLSLPHTSHIHLHSHHIHSSIISIFGTFISSYSSHGVIPIHNIYLHIISNSYISILPSLSSYSPCLPNINHHFRRIYLHFAIIISNIAILKYSQCFNYLNVLTISFLLNWIIYSFNKTSCLRASSVFPWS